jgi:ubiquinone/menaquinone biosynthesis C-methylase UbiE
MADDIKSYVAEIMHTTGELYRGLCIASGHIAGLLDLIKVDSPISVSDLAKRKNYDIEKVRRWVHFAAGTDIVSVDDKENVVLTTKGLLLSASSPVKDVLAFVEGYSYFIKAVDQADQTFKKNQSLDKLSDGKVSKDYQPRVSDNLSASMIDRIKQCNPGEKEKFLDVGCGNGSFIRALCRAFPSILFTGMDLNLFTIEKGKKENIALGLTDRIKLLVGDIVEDLDEIPEASYEWVSAINVMHFVPEEKRDEFIHQLIRIAGKGVFFNVCIADANLPTLTANSLMNLLWNDFTGFYTYPEFERLSENLAKKYRTQDIQTSEMMQGSSQLFTILKR